MTDNNFDAWEIQFLKDHYRFDMTAKECADFFMVDAVTLHAMLRVAEVDRRRGTPKAFYTPGECLVGLYADLTPHDKDGYEDYRDYQRRVGLRT